MLSGFRMIFVRIQSNRRHLG